MPRKSNTIEHTANQMMKSGKKGRLVISDNQKNAFIKRHEKQIIWAIDNMPRCTAAVYAVIVKSLIKYDNDLIAKFCKSLKKAMFNGQNDPAYVFWKFLQTSHGKDACEIYSKTVYAVEHFVSSKPVKSLQMSSKDIFDWDEDFTVPDDILPQWNPDFVPSSENDNSDLDGRLRFVLST